MPTNDWRDLAGERPAPEPCRVCSSSEQHKVKQVQTNKRFHARAAVCDDCLAVLSSVYVMRTGRSLEAH